MTSRCIFVTVSAARGLLAADKNGTSDPYAVAELVHTRSGKPLKKPRRLKTNVVKATLDPEWSTDEVEWAGVEEDVDDLSVRVRVLDDDFMRSDEVLGEVKIPLPREHAEDWYPLETTSKMRRTAEGAVCIKLRSVLQARTEKEECRGAAVSKKTRNKKGKQKNALLT
jgi:Ca2+-dependent lipid-binding protein